MQTRVFLALASSAILLTSCGVPKSEHAKLQAELKSKTEELEKAQSENRQRGEELAKAKVELQKSSAELYKARTDLAGSRSELARRNDDLARVQTAGGTTGGAGGQRVVVKKGKMPLRVSFRHDTKGSGLVAMFFNDTNRELAASLTVKTPAGGEPKEFKVTLPARGAAEFGETEGWAFNTGDQFVLKHDDFDEFQGSVR